ncbi:MAG: hypothetical protein HYR55_13400 [Acidobacteria bacterium]|nr:hypothetical protein [Acidobacteriota bacterium]
MCLESDQWYEYKHGLLSKPAMEELARRKEACTTCAEMLIRLEKADKLLDAISTEPEIPTPQAQADDPCLDEQVMADLVAGALPEANRESLLAHMERCQGCCEDWIALHQMVAAAKSSEVPLPSPTTPSRVFNRSRTALREAAGSPTAPLATTQERHRAPKVRWVAIPVCCVVLLSLLLVWRAFVTQQAQELADRGTQHLITGLGVTRFSDLRLSGGFQWSIGLTRGKLDDFGQSELAKAEAALKKAYSTRPNDPKINQALGRFYLITYQLSLAREHLTKAHGLDPSSAAICNDLGVLAYESALRQSPGVMNAFAEASRYFDEAMKLDPRFAEPVFNAALLQIIQFKNAEAAKRFIALYRKLDPSGTNWIDEVEFKLQRLTR